MPEWKPGVLEGLLKEIGNTGRANQRIGLLKIAAAVEAEAKAELGKSSHPHGTPSPAPRGGPPSLVSGTGRRSITHQYMGSVGEPEVRVGTAAGVFPPAELSKTGRRSRRKANSTGHGRTPSSKYLWYQETLSRFNHPFLKPAFRRVVGTKGVKTWLESFRKWPHL